MSSVVGDSQISLKWCWRHLLAVIQFAVSCSEISVLCLLLCPEKDWNIRIGKLGYVKINFV